MSALKWLRGWVSDDEVIDEYHSLELYCETSQNEYKTRWETRIKKKTAGYTGVPGLITFYFFVQFTFIKLTYSYSTSLFKYIHLIFCELCTRIHKYIFKICKSKISP